MRENSFAWVYDLSAKQDKPPSFGAKYFSMPNIQFLGNRGIVEKSNFWCIMVYGELIAAVGNMAMVLSGIVIGYGGSVAV